MTLAELRERVAAAVDEAASPWSKGGVEELAAVHAALADALAAGPSEAEGRELRGLLDDLLREGVLAPLRGVERVQVAVDGLADAGPPSEIIDNAASAAAQAIGLDRVILSRIDQSRLVAEAVHCGADAGDPGALLARLQAAPVALEYPLVEAELLRRRQAQIVASDEGHAAWGETMEWREYLAGPIAVAGRAVGFLHGDRQVSGRPLRAFDRDALWRFTEAFAAIFERAVLHQRLRIQRQELRQVASWADARTSELSDAAIDLGVEGQAAESGEAIRARPSDSRLRDLLTRRELDVLEHMVKGETNADIARALVVSPGTVKFHVKNILRKLNASNRAEATSRYLRLSLRESDGSRLP